MHAAKDVVRIAALGDLHHSRTAPAGALQPLFAQISEEADILVLCGDLTDYGLPEEAKALVRELAPLKIPSVAVLGNHDLSLLVIAAGHSKPHRGDTIDEILAAPDREELLHWLRHQKMMHAEDGHAMVHAGLLPQWTIEHALALAREVEAALQAPDYSVLLRHMYGNRPDRWDDSLGGFERLRVIVNAMTRLRLCVA